MINSEYGVGARKFIPDLVKYYEISLVDYIPITHKTYKLSTENGQQYFLKETTDSTLNKYQYLESKGISNVLYPILNKEKRFITKTNNLSFYINDYLSNIPVRDDIKAANLFNELNILHHQTTIRKNLDPSKARVKFDELSSQLDYKFRMLELLVRKVESKPLDMFSMPILENYHYILDAKRELIKLQKRIISSVKAKESVEYSFVHNNPSIDHLLNVRGVNYLTSLDHSKIGISSLDMAKFYVLNEHLDIDYKSLILNEYYNENQLFYYDYFRYLVLVIYIKRMNVSTEEYVNANLFVSTANVIQRYFHNFSDYQEETSKPDQTNYNNQY